MANIGDVSVLNINGNELTIKDAALTEIVNEIINAIGANNDNIAERINNLHDRSFDAEIKISSVNETEISNIVDGLYKVQYVTITGEGTEATETLNNSAILIQKGTNQYLIKDAQISSRTKTNGSWGTWASNNVKPDWEATAGSAAEILNKPDLSNFLTIETKSNWNETNTSSAAYIQNKPIVRTIINLEDELPSRLINAIGEENAITLTAEEASQLEALKVKMRSDDSNGYPYVYMFAGMQVYPDVDATYNYIITFDGIDFAHGGVRSWVSTSIEHNNIGNFSAGDDAWINLLVDHITTDSGTNNYIKKSSTSGLIKNDGTIDTNNYIISSNVASTVTQNDTNPVSGGAVYTKFADLIGSAPAALDTLQEIATALNNDADLAGTLTTQISSKVPKVSNPTTDNFASFNSDGTIKDSGHSHSDYITSIKTVNNESLVGTGNIVVSGLPQVSASDNGKILMVVNGQWQLVSPSVLYTGQGLPNNAQGNNGDLYIQTD